ncbi:hypothetical protein DS884_04005 [Tenacibaculum sp. E3R01]|uniref:hypothetical protein n=1 Tax=unclassified Tenacibaculum TaxID=2635139 RepID=UPI00089840D6|nr:MULTISPECIES: hypothetical protein [unclassified Tenacibaculum]RBW61002.1 hypothetical protein DS884_04005 [Tenacibaculum sp. E3R01]SEE16862.1 hypothetical protein SAMN04487765_1630 [Tenacibaculum sp. MAR_2010_89]
MSLFHIFFNKYSDEYNEHYKNYSLIIKERNQVQDSLLKELGNTLTISEYKKARVEKWKLSQNKLKIYTKKKKRLAKEHSFRGRSSFRLWIYMFGLVILGLLFSCKSLYHDIVNGSTFKFQFISITGIAVSFFWVIHLTFLTHNDFSKNSYIIILLVAGALSSCFTYFLVKNYTYKDDLILKQLSLIDRIKTVHYPRVALKALYSERNDKAMLSADSVKENTNAFDDDIVTTLKGV